MRRKKSMSSIVSHSCMMCAYARTFVRALFDIERKPIMLKTGPQSTIRSCHTTTFYYTYTAIDLNSDNRRVEIKKQTQNNFNINNRTQIEEKKSYFSRRKIMSFSFISFEYFTCVNSYASASRERSRETETKKNSFIMMA